MSQKHILLFSFILSQGAWGKPMDLQERALLSSGAQLQNDFNKNLATTMNNLYAGATSITTPSITFGVDTVPGIIHHGVNTFSDKINKISGAGKEGFGKVAVGLGHAVGGGGVLGSSIAGGALQMAGHGIGVGGSVIDAGAKAGVNFLGKVGDEAASGISVGGTLANDALTVIGNGMNAAGAGVNLLSNGLSGLLDAVGLKIAIGIGKAEHIISGLLDAGVLKLENGALTFSANAQTNIYKILNSFLQILVNVQNLFDSLKVSISGSLNSPDVVNSGSAAASSGSQGSGTQGGVATGATTKKVKTLSSSADSEKMPRKLILPTQHPNNTK